MDDFETDQEHDAALAAWKVLPPSMRQAWHEWSAAWVASRRYQQQAAEARAQAAEAEAARLQQLVTEALPLIEDEWIGTQGPFGDGGEWIERARVALAPPPPAEAVSAEQD